jgi:hypothetical protein
MVAAGVLTLAGPVVTLKPPVAGATLIYTASAAASGVRVTESVPGGPGAETLVDGGGPTAQSLLTSGAGGISFASFPYPGDAAVALPGQLAGLAPQIPRLPDYPFYVRADQSDPQPAPVEAPGVHLTATATPAEAVSAAHAGPGIADDGSGVGRLESTARSTSSEASVTAMATGTASTVTIGPLRIASVVSTATVVLEDAGSLRRASSLRVDGMTVDGQGVAIVDGELVLAAGSVPLPKKGPVTDALAAAGLDVEYLARQDTPSGLVSEGLAVRRTQETGNGPVTVRFTFGQAVAAIDGATAPGVEPPAVGIGGIPDAAAADSASLPARPVPNLATPVLAASDLPGVAPFESGQGLTGTPLPGAVADTAALTGTLDPAPEARTAPATPQLAAAPAVSAPVFFDTTMSYLALVAAAAVALGVAFLVSTMGVRFGWKH